MNFTLSTLLDYSAWANTRLSESLAPLPDELLTQEVPSSFSSVAKTLRHMWDAEVIWYRRMEGESLSDWPSKNFQGTQQELIAKVVQSSYDLKAFIDSKGPDFLNSKIRYKNLKGDWFEDEVSGLLYHVVNHGTYHRGQITTMLRSLKVESILSTDIIIYLRSQNK